ncbi:MAG TPA: hypothetical protein VF733_06815 [Candidatus Saccharimonadales bacterium]
MSKKLLVPILTNDYPGEAATLSVICFSDGTVFKEVRCDTDILVAPARVITDMTGQNFPESTPSSDSPFSDFVGRVVLAYYHEHGAFPSFFGDRAS